MLTKRIWRHISLKGTINALNNIFRIEHMQLKEKNFINEIKNGIYQVSK